MIPVSRRSSGGWNPAVRSRSGVSSPATQNLVSVSTRGILFIAGLWLAFHPAGAAEIQVAVASNFSTALQELAARFEEHTSHRITVIPGATGKHFTQITNGAPFDLFLAADTEHPKRMVDRGLALPDSRFTYATGRLVLWSPTAGLVDAMGDVLRSGGFRHLAMAHPELAPYGRAAGEVLASLGLEVSLEGRIVRGENVSQTFQFIVTGNADLGFVALSQVRTPDGRFRSGSHWLVPQELYSPIDQQAVLLQDNQAAREFLRFLETEEARGIIRRYGYLTP